jgi:hypothetical protein
MQRIIYLDIDLGYKATDVKNQYQLMNKQIEITKHGYYIVCLVDLDNKLITQKSDSFSAHADFIKKCYPEYILESVLVQNTLISLTPGV